MRPIQQYFAPYEKGVEWDPSSLARKFIQLYVSDHQNIWYSPPYTCFWHNPIEKKNQTGLSPANNVHYFWVSSLDPYFSVKNNVNYFWVSPLDPYFLVKITLINFVIISVHRLSSNVTGNILLQEYFQRNTIKNNAFVRLLTWIISLN